MITLLIVALITNGRTIREGLWNGFRAVIQWLVDATSGSGEKEVIEEPPPPPSMEPAFPFEEPKEPSAIAEFLEMITMYVMYVLLAAAIVLIVFLFIKKTRTWIINGFKKLIQFLKEIVSQMTEREEDVAYVEEKESVFNWQEWKDEQQSKAKGLVKNIFQRKPNWNALSNQEKVRFVFRNFLMQEADHRNLKRNGTPREILEQIKLASKVDEKQIEQLRSAYEQTRYGEQNVDEQIVSEIYTLIEKK